MILNRYGDIAKNSWLDLPNHHKGIELDQFIIMPNHIHGIIIVNNPTTGGMDENNIQKYSLEVQAGLNPTGAIVITRK